MGTVKYPVTTVGGRATETIKPPNCETLSTLPDNATLSPVDVTKKAITGILSSSSFISKLRASSSEIMFGFIKEELGEARASLWAHISGYNPTL